jgi:hypothetical protein
MYGPHTKRNCVLVWQYCNRNLVTTASEWLYDIRHNTLAMAIFP